MAVNGTITLRDQQGGVIAKQTISFPAHSSTPVALKTLLAAAGAQAHSGSVTLEQDPAIKGPALLSQLSMTLHSGSQSSFLEEEFGMPTLHGSMVMQAVASQTRNFPLVAITSVSDVAQTITASCAGENNAISKIELPAYGTAVVQACSWRSIQDNSLNLSSSLLSSGGDVEADHAITLKTDMVPGSYYAFGFALNGGLDHPQLQPLDFYDPGLLASDSIIYVGVPTGAVSALNAVLSAPVLTLANFSSQPRHTTVTLSDSSSGSPKLQLITTLILSPLSVKTTTLSSVKSSGLLNSFILASDGNPGDVQAHLFTRVGSSQQRTELLAKDARDDHNGGDHPWSVANGDTSTLLLYNSTSQPLQFQVRISGSGSSWLQLFQLAGNETRAISINDVVTNGIGDRKGTRLSQTLTSGEVQWSTDHGPTGFGRLLVANGTQALARSFSCELWWNICEASFGANNYMNGVVGSTITLSEVDVTFCTEQIPNGCSYTSPAGNSYSFNTNWTLSAGITGLNEAPGLLQLSGGSATSFNVNAEAYAGSCQAGPMNGGGTVQVPTALKAIATTSNGAASCPSGQSGWQRVVTRGVIDQNGQAIQVGNQSVGETLTLTQPGLGNGPIATHPGLTDASGQYPDTFSICSNLCPNGSRKTNTATQTNTDTLPNGGATYNLTNSIIQYGCTYIKLNGAF